MNVEALKGKVALFFKLLIPEVILVQQALSVYVIVCAAGTKLGEWPQKPDEINGTKTESALPTRVFQNWSWKGQGNPRNPLVIMEALNLKPDCGLKSFRPQYRSRWWDWDYGQVCQRLNLFVWSRSWCELEVVWRTAVIIFILTAWYTEWLDKQAKVGESK